MQQIIVQPLLNNLMMIMAYLINIKTEAQHCQNHKKDLTPTIQVKLCLNKIPLDNRYDNEYNDMNSQMMGIQNAVTARPGHARNSSASAGFVNVQLSVRPLPVYEKQEVFNEWGAVLKHQDEIDREIKRKQDDKFTLIYGIEANMKFDIKFGVWNIIFTQFMMFLLISKSSILTSS